MMQRLFHHIGVFCFGLTLVSLINPCYATNKTSLKVINQKISTLQQHLQLNQTHRHQLQTQLRDIEVKSSNSTVKLKKIQQQLKQKKASIHGLIAKQAKYQSQLSEQQNILAKQIRAAYLFGRVPYLKLLLNQKDTAKISRTLTYYRYICEARADTIKKIRKILTKLQQNQNQQQLQITNLHQIHNELLHTHKKLFELSFHRKKLLLKIKQKINSQQQRLTILSHNKHRLEKTIRQIEHQAQARQALNYNFAKLRGKLMWPTHGRLITKFNQIINHSQLRSKGVLIKAKLNQAVKAIANGKVIFAKWLSGYGLLLIISHGHGFMTIYGRNHVLYKKVGDIVQQGDVIATVGRSGGFTQPALYFAIRHNAKALNPTRWMKR
jgi:murein hydrolase activator